MTEPTRDALHAETLALLKYLQGVQLFAGGHDYENAPDAQLAYAAECVKRVPELEAKVERLTASNRKLITMLEEEAYHRMAAESRAQPDGGNVRIEVTDSAEVERLRAKAAIVDAMEFYADDANNLRALPDIPWGIGGKSGSEHVAEWRNDLADRIERVLAAVAAATREGTDA